MDSVINKSSVKPKSGLQPLISKNVEIDVGMGSVQVGSFGCDGCSILLYSFVDKTIVTFRYVDGKIETEQTVDLAINPAFMFELIPRQDNDNGSYYAIAVHVHGVGVQDLIGIKDFTQAKLAYAELDALTARFRLIH